MTTAQVVGTVAGAVLGFFTGGAGWALAASMMMGAAVGFAAGAAVDPTEADVPSPGQQNTGEVDLTTVAKGVQINDALGTVKVVGTMIYHCRNRTKEVTEKYETGGKGGGGGNKEEVVTGYKHYLTWVTALCMGPVDMLYAVLRNEDVVWQGNVSPDADGDGTTITIDSMGAMTIFWGTDGHTSPNNFLSGDAAKNKFTLDDYHYKGLCFVLFDDCYIGPYNRAPVMRFIIRKTPTYSWHSSGKNVCGDNSFEHNPAAGIYYLLDQAGFSSSWIDNASFSDVCDALYTENRGMCCMMGQEQSALSYIESVIAHFGLVLRYDIDGTFHLKAIRSEDTSNLVSIDADNDLLEPIEINTKTWLETLNEIKVQYSQIIEGEV